MDPELLDILLTPSPVETAPSVRHTIQTLFDYTHPHFTNMFPEETAWFISSRIRENRRQHKRKRTDLWCDEEGLYEEQNEFDVAPAA